MTHAGPALDAGHDGTAIEFAGLDRPCRVALPASPEFVRALDLALPAWPRRPVPAGVPPADVTVHREGTAWRVEATGWPGGESPAADPLSAANALAGLLVDGQLVRVPQLVGLHGAAAVFAAGVVVALGETGAGKSTLALRLAARGIPILGDDRVLVDTRDDPGPVIVALGLSARARLPLPPGDDRLAAFVERHTAEWVGDAAWLDGRAACPFGTRAPLAGFVMLERRAGAGAARLEPVGGAALAARLIEQATAPAAGPAELVARLARLATTGGQRLVYDDGAAACDVLVARFGAVR